MLLETLGLDSAVKLATPIAKKLFKSKLQPLIESKVANFFKTKKAKKHFEMSSIKYIARLTGQCSIMNTIAFQNAPKKLEDLYINLTIVSGNGDEKIVVDDDSNVFKSSNHILINDTAGMGKSTLSKKIILNVIKQNEYIPVFIELRQIENKPIEEFVAENFGLPVENCIDIIKELPLLYVLDGMDEVPNDIKKNVIVYLKAFIEEVGDSKIMVTSRDETFLSEFYSFTQYRIQKLNNNEAYSLLSKCDPVGNVSKKLILGIKGNHSRGIREFLSTPLYVSLLFCAYRYKTVIPQKKHLFYSQVYEALFESHDLSKEIGFVRPKYSKLDSAEFHSVLRRLGFWCLKNNGQIEFQKDALEIVVSELLSNINGIDAKAPSFVKDLTTTVPLFVKEGSTLRWSHKSLMEYFASMFICNDAKTKQAPLLLKFFEGDSWSSVTNMFELCADIDYGTFRVAIVRKVLEKYINHTQSTHQKITNRLIAKNLIELRASLTFSFGCIFEMSDKTEIPKFDDVILRKFVGSRQKEVTRRAAHIRVMQHQKIVGVDSSITCIFSEDKNTEIMRIIRSKSPELFLKTSKKKRDYELLVENSTLKKEKTYVLDDNPKSLINNSKNFGFVNYIISSFNDYVLDKKAVINELSLLEEDESNGINDLIDGV